MGKLVNKFELAEIIGKSERTITTWQKNGMPISVDGKRGEANQYDSQEVIDWFVQREINNVLQMEGSDKSIYNFEVERARHEYHKANIAEMEQDLKKGQTIEMEIVSEVQNRMFAGFRAKCLSLPSKIAPRVVYLDDLAEIENELRTAIYDALHEFAEFKPEQYGISVIQEYSEDDNPAA